MAEKVSVSCKTVAGRRHTRQLLEDKTELHDVGETQVTGHLRRRCAGGKQHPFGCLQTLDVQKFSQGASRFEAEQVAEIGLAEVQRGGTFGSRGETPALQTSRSDIVVQPPLQTGQQFLVLVLAGDELTFVETGAIIQQQLDEARNENTAVRVNGMMKLLADIVEIAQHALRLALRQVEGFLLAVAEEGVVIDMTVEGGAPQQVGMKSKQEAAIRQSIVPIHTEDLAGRKKYHRGMGKVIIAPPAATAIIHTILYQENGVEFKLHALFHHRFFPVQTDEGGLRMQCFTTQATVALAHSLYVQYVVMFHPALIFHCKGKQTNPPMITRITDLSTYISLIHTGHHTDKPTCSRQGKRTTSEYNKIG